MCRLNRLLIVYLFFSLLFIETFSQDCTFKIQGIVKDVHTGIPLSDVNISIKELKKGGITDEKGAFGFKRICQGSYHIIISHIGCETQSIFINLLKDTTLHIGMEHTAIPLEDVVVESREKKITTQSRVFITEKIIKDNIHQSISNILESTSGVSLLKTGNTIAKPIVHGLYGNRLAIINNGIPQSGQQWGNDHSPEIDPLAANKLTVIKGANALEYADVNFGGVILVESYRVSKDPHFHGYGNYFFETNGQSHGLNLRLQQYKKSMGWKVNGTYKKSGDKKTPNYFLTNTGTDEKHFSFQLEKDISPRFSTHLFFSSFNSKLGILRGAHISNLTDLREALIRQQPFGTKDKFSYKFSAPYQEVNHHLLKLNSTLFIRDNQTLSITLAGQMNLRKEYDIRRNSTDKRPSLSLAKYSFYGEGKYTHYLKNGITLKTGLQLNFLDNTNDYTTGILPLIPDFFALNSGVYTILTKNINSWFFEFGLRYENSSQDVVTISRNVNRDIIRYSNNFHNFSSSLGFINKINRHINLYFNLGYATRNPAINELYSNGLHQGVSGIEEGDPNLRLEKSLKSTLALNANIDNRFSFETLFYYHRINNYVYLKPQDEFRLTIRGAYPVFEYTQTPATIYGFDFSSQMNFSKTLNSKLLFSYIKARDTKNNLPLINIPSSNIALNFQLVVPREKISNTSEGFELSVENKYVFKKKDILDSQDYIPSPDGYYLLGVNVAWNIPRKHNRWKIFVKSANLLNTTYRDYLNRQKYFSDEVGRNIILGLNLQF